MVLEDCDRRLIDFAYRAITVSGGPFQAPSATDQLFGLRRGSADPLSRLTTPLPQRLPAITRVAFELFPFRSPLLRESFLFLEVLRCFSSLGALPPPMNSGAGDQG